MAAAQLTPALFDGRIGTTLLGKWRLDALLGVGGMATVYAATHRNGSRCAVKMLHSSEGGERKSRFRREGYIANSVGHAGVVRVLDDDIAEDGSAFLVMELLEGMALHEYADAQRGRLTVQQVLISADQLLDVLAAAHARGIIHRDIKPENVFITKDGRVKILDFGIARMVEGPGKRTTQTLLGRAIGTPAFMPPEQARGRWDLVGPMSDLWSVGATMFTVLTAQFVHVGDTPEELAAATFTRPARKLRNVMPEAPREIANVVDKALELRMADRWPTASAMQDAVREAYERIEGEEMPDAPPESVGRRISRVSTIEAGRTRTCDAKRRMRAPRRPVTRRTGPRTIAVALCIAALVPAASALWARRHELPAVRGLGGPAASGATVFMAAASFARASPAPAAQAERDHLPEIPVVTERMRACDPAPQ